MDIYEFRNYRKLLGEWVNHSPDRGARSRLAEAAQCSPSWITRVLNGSVQFTPDQALAIAEHLQLNELETDYFMLLVELERASSPALRARIEKRLALLRAEGGAIRSSVKTDASVTEESRVRYYSSWVYQAIHVFCMIGPQSVEEVSARLKLSLPAVKSALGELRAMGLIVIESGKFRATSKSVHLPSQHAMAGVAHANWRQKTLQWFQESGDAGLHYSAVHCLSRKDMERVQRILKDAVLSCRKTIEASSSETLGVFCVDWYGI